MTEIVELAPEIDAVALRLGIAQALRFFGALILGSLAIVIADSILAGLKLTGITSIPIVGGAIKAGIEDALVKPAEAIFQPLEQEFSTAIYGLGIAVGVVGSNDLVLVRGVHNALSTLWHVALPGFVAAAVLPVRRLASEAHALARTAETTAAKALSKVQAIKVPSVTHIWNAIKGEVQTRVDTGVKRAEKYAASAVTEVAAGPAEAAVKIASLAELAAEHPAKAFTHALATAEGLAIPVGKDVGQLEDYIKGLGTAGLVATIPALAYLTQALVNEAGLSKAECRSKVGGICGTNPAAWESLLAGLVAVGVGFNLRDLVRVAEEIAKPVEALVKQAA